MDSALLDLVTAWQAREEDIDFHAVSSIDELVEVTSNRDFSALLLDTSTGISPSIIKGMADKIPGTGFLIYPSSIEPVDQESWTAAGFRLLSTPFSIEEVRSTLKGPTRNPAKVNKESESLEQGNLTTQTPLQPKSPVATPPSFLSFEDEFSYLKDWLFDESSDKETEAISEGDERANEADAAPVENGSTHPSTVDQEEQPAPDSPAEKLGDTEPIKITRHPVEINPYAQRLPYCCVVIPRQPQHFLTRGISDRLGLILPQIHLNRGWRMTGVSIRPQYLMWFFTLPIDVSPVDAVREVQKQTSELLLKEFPELNTNTSDDFWSQGYLLLSGETGIPQTMIKALMERTWNPSSSTG